MAWVRFLPRFLRFFRGLTLRLLTHSHCDDSSHQLAMPDSLISPSASQAPARSHSHPNGRAIDRLAQLDRYYHPIKSVILARQHPISGLLPASTAITIHGNYTDAWVRDNVFSILAVWGLALAYRKVDHDQGRRFELEHSVIKLMRSLLQAMMRQANKVERFKQTQSLQDALHAKYDTATGNPVVGDLDWGHLQLDATSLFLLMLAQMIASGLPIIYTLDEVNFVQNLIFYLGRAYRTPDYGIWERGNKINKGVPELNASSIGMAKAALEAIHGLDLFGVHGSQASVVHVLPDEIARTRMTLESLLPRESGSKEIDAALLGIISYPAFAVDDPELVDRTRDKIIDRLQGRYGCKRFLRDGHQTVLEDTRRLHYEADELQQFEHIECEWPLFFTYLLLDGLFRHDPIQVQHYQDRLEALAVERDGVLVLPELYYVPLERIEAERRHPQSQDRLPNANVPLLWAQSLYWLGQLIQEGLLDLSDIDPLGRHRRMGRKRSPIVQIALLSEDPELQLDLAAHGVATQTLAEVDSIEIRHANDLSQAYTQVGRNDPLGLTGRPYRRLRSLTTSRIYRLQGRLTAFLPSMLDQQQSYLALDPRFWVAELVAELAYLHRHWDQLGRPTLTVLITHPVWESGQTALLELIQTLQTGWCEGVPVKVGSLRQHLLTAGIERIDNLHDVEFAQAPLLESLTPTHFLNADPEQSWPLSHVQAFLLEYETDPEILLAELKRSTNLYEQLELLSALVRLQGLEFEVEWDEQHRDRSEGERQKAGDPRVTVADLVAEVHERAGQWQLWAIVRRSAGLLDQIHMGLADAVTDSLVRQKQITVGKSYSEDSLITSPLTNPELQAKINQFCSEDPGDRMLTQEILIYLGLWIKSNPDLVKGLLTLRVGYLILLLTSELAQDHQIPHAEAHERLMNLSPFELKLHLKQVLMSYTDLSRVVFQQESLHLKQPAEPSEWILPQTPSLDPNLSQPGGDPSLSSSSSVESWWIYRKRKGILHHLPEDCFPKLWNLLNHCRGLVIGDKLERRNCLHSDRIRSEMTPGEKNFALQIEHLLNKIAAPEYRCLTVEALQTLAILIQHHSSLQIDDYLVMDVVIGHAVRLAWFDQASGSAAGIHAEDHYNDHKAAAWSAFYDLPPWITAAYFVKALQFLTELAETGIPQAHS